MKGYALLVATLSIAIVLQSIGAPSSHASPPETKYKVVPGSVVKLAPPEHPPGSVGGSFQLVEASDGDPPSSIEDGTPVVTGGACLVYQDKRDVKPCDTQADCTAPAGGHGYCNTTEHACWFKDASTEAFPVNADGYRVEAYCLKSGYDRSLSVDKVNALRVVRGHPTKYRWRITSCQGITRGGCAGGVEDVNLRTRWGDVLEP